MSVSGTTVASPVASLSQWTLDMAKDSVEVTSFEDANKTYVQGLKDLKGTLNGFWDDTNDTLFTGVDSVDGVLMYLYPSINAASRYWAGPAWVSATLDVANNGAVKLTGSFQAKGSWIRNTTP